MSESLTTPTRTDCLLSALRGYGAARILVDLDPIGRVQLCCHHNARIPGGAAISYGTALGCRSNGVRDRRKRSMKRIKKQVSDAMEYSTDKGWHIPDEPLRQKHAREGGTSRHTKDGETFKDATPFYGDDHEITRVFCG